MRLIRDGEKGGGEGVSRGGTGEIIYLSLHCHHHNDSCIKMGSNESHFCFRGNSCIVMLWVACELLQFAATQ